MSYRILNETNAIMRVGWKDPDNPGQIKEVSVWETLEEAEEALYLLTHYAIGGALSKNKGLKIVKMADG